MCDAKAKLDRELHNDNARETMLASHKSHLNDPEDDFYMYGVKYLDDTLSGISKNDLVVISSKTGRGKTQLATLIALTNALANKKVLYYALEAERGEIENRIRYTIFADEYFNNYPTKDIGTKIGYINFKAKHYKEIYKNLAPDIEKRIDDRMKNLSVFYRGPETFTSETLSMHLSTCESHYDLFIIDHLHYLDRPDASRNEMESVQRTMKQIRDMVLLTGKPIVLLAHVRKGSIMDKAPMPSIEDVYGTSDVIKIATKVIFIAPRYAKTEVDYLFNTYFNIAKCRDDGSVTRDIAECKFNVRSGRYESDYKLGYFKGMEFTPYENQMGWK